MTYPTAKKAKGRRPVSSDGLVANSDMAPSRAWARAQPADNRSDDADEGKGAERHGLMVQAAGHEVKFIIFSTS
jgi:hypothetical protein